MILDPLSRPVLGHGQRWRGLRPVSPDDAALFAAVMRGEHLIDGLSNRSLQASLFSGPPPDDTESRRRSGQISRKLRLLRRHGLIHKLGKRRLYRITGKGHQVMSLAGLLRRSNAEMLNAA